MFLRVDWQAFHRWTDIRGDVCCNWNATAIDGFHFELDPFQNLGLPHLRTKLIDRLGIFTNDIGIQGVLGFLADERPCRSGVEDHLFSLSVMSSNAICIAQPIGLCHSCGFPLIQAVSLRNQQELLLLS
eukprot:scpid105483/ scgid23626/ 